MKYLYLLLICFSCFALVNGQSVGVNNPNPAASALLDIKSSNKGVLLPRMSTTNRELIANPANGLLVFDTDRKSLFLFDSSAGWKILVAQDPNSANSYSNNQQIIPSGIVAGSEFYADQLGSSVAVWNDYAFIGAPGAYNRSGYVLVYHLVNDQWQFKQILKPNTPVDNMKFGITVKAKENYLFVGATADNNFVPVNCGAVYVYSLSGSNWVFQSRLLPSAAINNGTFGTYMDVNTNADQLVVYGAGNSLINIFKRSGSIWGAPQAITLANVTDIAMQQDGDLIACGVINSTETINNISYNYPGKVKIYLKSGSNYVFNTDIVNPSPANDDNFGKKLSFGQNYSNLYYILLVGSTNQVQIGSIYIATQAPFPFQYNFTGAYSATLNGNEDFGNWISKAYPNVSNFYFSGVSEYFFAGDNEKIAVYASGGGAAWFAKKGGSITLPEAVSYINFGTKYSMDTYASSVGFNTSPTHVVIGTPYANDGKGAFYFLKF